MIFRPFNKQKEFLLSRKRKRGAFAGKRGGKTEVGAIEAVVHTEQKRGYVHSDIDPYIGVILAPTTDMLRRLSLMKFLAYAAPFQPRLNKSSSEVRWPNGSIIYGISADKPQRLEGIKANWIWLDEVFQMPEQIYTEAQARVADTKGRIWCTGSLGVQYNNPKAHWVYKHFKENPDSETESFEWATADNPYFPRDEIERLKDTLDPLTYRQMFELSWDVQGTNLVYEDFSKENEIQHYAYNPDIPTYVSIDWGWTHPAAVLFLQYNPATDTVYLFDEIVRSKMTRENMWDAIQSKIFEIETRAGTDKMGKPKNVRIFEWYCDIAGLQTREDSGVGNIQWFKDTHQIHFRYRPSSVAHGISLVRNYIKNMRAQRRFFIDTVRCPRTLDEFKNYSYKLRKSTGELTEDPVDVGDDAMAALRYFFVNKLDYTRPKDSFGEMSRWQIVGV